MKPRTIPKKEIKPRIMVIDAGDPVPEKAGLPWDDLDRYRDQRRSYLVKMADTVIIRNADTMKEAVVKAPRGAPTGFIRFLMKDVVDTMLSCGFGFAG